MDPQAAALLSAIPFVTAIRAHGFLTGFTLVPGTAQRMFPDGTLGADTFNLTVSATDLNLRIGMAGTGQQYDVHLDSLGFVCPGVIENPSGGCGEVVVRCAPPTVSFSGLSTTLPLGAASLALPDVLQGELVKVLGGGVRLHFHNRVVSSFAFVQENGATWLRLKGEPTNGCSPTPRPVPPLATTRGVVRAHSIVGSGEVTNQDGTYSPVEILPELKVDWTKGPNGASDDRVFLNPTSLSSGQHTFAAAVPIEAPRFVPSEYRLRLRATRRVGCPQNPLALGSLIPWAGRNFAIDSTDAKGKRSLSQKLSEEALSGEAHFSAIEEVNFEEVVAPLIREFGDDTVLGIDSGDRWTRLRIALNADPVGDPQPLPQVITIWMDRPLLEVQKFTGIQLACDLPGAPKSERIFTMPIVTFDSLMIDSTEFSSVFDQASGVGIKEDFRGNTAVQSKVTSSRGPAVQVELTPSCLGVAGACWLELVGVPERGSFSVMSGFSSTTVARVPISAGVTPTFNPNNALLYGARVAAVHGNLDRSAIESYTFVPQIYHDLGLVPANENFDFRGLMYLDWEHGSGFPAPGGPSHAQSSSRSDWSPSQNRYWANWATDRMVFKARSEPWSMCPLREQLFATPLEFRAEGAGLPMPVVVPARDVIQSGVVDGAGNFRVSEGSAAAGNFSRVSP